MAVASSIVKFTSPVVFDCEDDFFKTFHLRPGPVLGEGVSGPVVFAKCYKDTSAEPRAVKLFTIRKGSSRRNARQEERFAQEVSIMNGLNHPNLMCQVTAGRCPRYFAISMKYCPKGALDDYLIVNDFSPEVLGRYTVQLACAVRYLHDACLYHGDIKLENILLDSKEDLILSDFGHSQILPSSSQMVTGVGGTVPYIAPEVGTKDKFDAWKLDAYAMGVVIWCMLTNKNASNYEHRHFSSILEKKPFVDSLFCPLVNSLLQENPEIRWNVSYFCEQLKTLPLNGSFTSLL